MVGEDTDHGENTIGVQQTLMYDSRRGNDYG